MPGWESIPGLLNSLKIRLWLRHRDKRGMKDDAVAEWFEPKKTTAKSLDLVNIYSYYGLVNILKT
jgi:hypothetical protein